MKRLLGLVLLCVCLLAPARAQDAATMKAAQDLAALVNADSVQQMSSAMITQMWGGLEAQLGSKVDVATKTELRAELERLLVKFVTDAMKDAPSLYARHFTAAEMNDILAFYKTPTGAKALREMPKVSAEIFTLLTPRMAPFQQEVAMSVGSIMKKHGYDK